jgi:hypothetical protein
MLITVSYLFSREDNIDQVLPKFAGKSLLQADSGTSQLRPEGDPHGFINV